MRVTGNYDALFPAVGTTTFERLGVDLLRPPPSSDHFFLRLWYIQIPLVH